MTKKINKKFLFTLLLFISFIIIFAYVVEYKLGHQPCKLCLYERIPYFLSILLITKIFFIKMHERETLFILSLVFVTSTLLAFYHFGIEQDFFTESSICKSTNTLENISKEKLLEQLKLETVSCKDITFKIFGFSLAAINTVFSIIFSVIFMKLFINYGKN